MTDSNIEAIETKDLVFFESERRTDNEDGGGKYNGKIIEDGESNNAFDDISEVDRLGNVSMRKVFAAVTTNNTEKLMGATVFISKNPQDPAVSALLFDTNSWTDTRKNAQNRVENYLAKGAQAAGTPLDTHWQGMKALQVAMFTSETEMAIGDAICLISNEGKMNAHEQYLRITEVSTRIAKMVINDREVEYKIASYMLSDPLDVDYIGLSAAQWYSGTKSTTIIRETLVADTGKYCGSANLVEDANVGEQTVVADTIYRQIVPSSQAESQLINISAAGEAIALVAAKSDTITKAYNVTVNQTQVLYLGSAVLPKSVSFTLFNSAVVDDGGELKNANNVYVGTIDYKNGMIAWNVNAGTGTATLNITFKPAAAVTAPVESELILVNQQNNSFNWIRNLVPLPAPGSVQVSYQVGGNIYPLKDNGTGKLSGIDTAYGIGSIDYENGTVSITTGELPDAGSGILITWSGVITAQERSTMPLSKAYVEIPLDDSVVAGTLAVSWSVNGVNKTATDNGSGVFTGDATGKIDYADGIAKLMPTILPNGGTTFTVSGQKGAKLSVQLSAVPNNGSVAIALDNGASALIPRSVKVRVPVKFMDKTGEVELIDEPINASTGRMMNNGVQQGTINYATRTITVTPSRILKQTERELVTYPYYGSHNTSIEAIEAGYKGLIFKYQNNQNQYTLSLEEVATAISVAVAYRDSSAASALNEQIIGTVLHCDLTEGYAEQILSGSIRFTLGGSTYIDRIGSLYRNPSITTGSGTLSGQVNYGTGAIQISSWDVGGSNNPTLEALATQLGAANTNQVSFRAPAVPIRPQSLTITATKVAGGSINVVPDVNGNIDTAIANGSFNYEQGYGQVVFRSKIQITAQNRPQIEAQDWYHVENEVQENGNVYIFEPIMVLPESIKFNAVSYTYLPMDPEQIGLSPTRLPLDGRVPIFRKGEIVVVSATRYQQFNVAVAGQTYQLNDMRIAYCELVDSLGVKVPYDMYTVDYDYGRYTLNGDFALVDLELPFTAEYRYQDMARVSKVDINGTITLTKALTHNYLAEETIVGSVIYIGDLQARYTNKFTQQAWNDVWSDAQTGSVISANYNDAIYPFEVTNLGAIQERWCIEFTSATNFKCTGEYTGELALTGTITADFTPINPVTNAPYFVIKKEGWGAGWVNGNALRFNTIAANYPIWMLRTVQSSEPAVMSDSFQIMLRGDIDRHI